MFIKIYLVVGINFNMGGKTGGKKMKKSLVFLTCIMMFSWLFSEIPSLFSADGESLFNSKCGKCHIGENKTAPEVAPVKYAASQWKYFFKRNKHKRKKDISKEVGTDEIVLIKQYLVDHAADSDRPIAAGLR